MAAVTPIMSHAAHEGKKVCRYRNEPIKMKSAAEPAMEMPSAKSTAPVMAIIRVFLSRGFRASFSLLRYSLSTAFNSFKNETINSFNEIFPSSKTLTPQTTQHSLPIAKKV